MPDQAGLREALRDLVVDVEADDELRRRIDRRSGVSRQRARWVAAAAAVLAVAGVTLAAVNTGEDSGGPVLTRPAEDERASSTTQPPHDPTGIRCPNAPAPTVGEAPGTSSATFDDSDGTYAAIGLQLTAERRLSFDVVQWLSGDDADEEYRRATGESGHAENDYWVANENETIRTASIRADAEVLLLFNENMGDGGLEPSSMAELESYLVEPEFTVFWLTFDQGSITAICSQYLP